MIKIKDNKTKQTYTLLEKVPIGIKWELKVFFWFWFLSTSKSKKTWKEFYYGLIKHKCEFDYNKLEGGKYKHFPCKHHGCNIVTVKDEKGNWIHDILNKANTI